MPVTATRTKVSAADILLRHETDEARLTAIVDSMGVEGWSGRPVVLYRDAEGQLRNITGCHRIAAAAATGTAVDAMVLETDDVTDLDMIEFAAANDDHDAAWALRSIAPEIADLVAEG